MNDPNIERSHIEVRRKYHLFGLNISSPTFGFLALAYVWWLTHGPWFFMSLVIRGPRLAREQLDPATRAHGIPALNQLSDVVRIICIIISWGLAIFGVVVCTYVLVNGSRLIKLGGKDRWSGIAMVVLSASAFIWSIFNSGYYATWYGEPGRFGPTYDPDHDFYCQPIKPLRSDLPGGAKPL